MAKGKESAHIEIERDMEEEVRDRMRLEANRKLLKANTKLLEAAILGTRKEMEELRRLLQDDPAILDQVMWECKGKDNPLHVGALYGNVGFVREILNIKWELTRELNSEGQSPLHLASERGHVEVVREILSKDAYACFVRDKDGMIPLHLAAINGRVEVLKELVEAEKITAFILTKSGEPILHLCANNNKFKALKKLIEILAEQKDDLVQLRDRNNNTILHLLSAKGNYEVIKFLVETTAVDVKAENEDGITPFDVSLRNANLLRGFKIRMFLIDNGAKRGRVNSLFLRLLFGLDIKGDIDESWFAEALLVVAILMATVAFQARLNPPGGVWQDNGYHNATLLSPNSLQSSSPELVFHYAGESIMSCVDSRRYKLFSIFNDLMLALSLLVIQLLLLSYIFKSRSLKIRAILFTDFSLMVMSASYFASATFFSSDKLHFLTCSVVLVSSMALNAAFDVTRFELAALRPLVELWEIFKPICETARLES